jgi:hypothetical protein
MAMIHVGIFFELAYVASEEAGRENELMMDPPVVGREGRAEGWMLQASAP